MSSPLKTPLGLACLILSALSLPIYIFVIIVIFSSVKLRNMSFFFLNGVLGVVDILSVTIVYVFQRLPFNGYMPFVFESTIFARLSAEICNSGFFFIKSLQNYFAVLVAMNRFTAIKYPLSHDKFWSAKRRWTYVIVGTIVFLGPTIPLPIFSPAAFTQSGVANNSVASCIGTDPSNPDLPSPLWMLGIYFLSSITIAAGAFSALFAMLIVITLMKDRHKWKGLRKNARQYLELKLTFIVTIQVTLLIANGLLAGFILSGVESTFLNDLGYIIPDLLCSCVPYLLIGFSSDLRRAVLDWIPWGRKLIRVVASVETSSRNTPKRPTDPPAVGRMEQFRHN
ncbi:hypothetical protein L596_019411 [Steinernema carpocapsae]|uniref:G-protein coupled receptors family 1 profile domain-containing protein n=1 Tax=Steinernema carpocapsae TaxID=34508 RepID=A0A4U5MQM4_STECR|nr:hypothetical protein L596_019411 [Steinernema carpocapsae]